MVVVVIVVVVAGWNGSNSQNPTDVSAPDQLCTIDCNFGACSEE
jgi:hypothetical protein